MFKNSLNFIILFLLLALSVNASDNLTLGTPGTKEVVDSVIDREGYALGYSEKYEQPLWVIYCVTNNEITSPGVKRTNRFRADPRIKTGSAALADYKGSGYDRGHLAPAATMKFSKKTMNESFFMSNMSPQKPKFNRGIWKKLEAQVRKWAIDNEKIYVISGPIIIPSYETIGKNKVAIPQFFYKIIYDFSPPSYKMIAFILPNKASNKPLYSFVVTVDQVEQLTALDFFPKLPDDKEKKLESKSNIKSWKWKNKKKLASNSRMILETI